MAHTLTLQERSAKRFADDRVARSCGHKKRFASRKQVLAQVKNSAAAHPLFFYKCPVCRGFHLTSRPPAPQEA